ncbi:tripartite motif-containing protein 16-like protein isoform X2 [Labeo rohita]|nr:tripartite motif-containing protein 16-like protein isoform X2 [Labeo rohita]
MRKRFGPKEAVKITVEILRKMNQNHVAEQLEDKHKQGQAEGSTEDPAPVGAKSKPIEETEIIEDWEDMKLEIKIMQRTFRKRIQQREKDLQQLREASKSYKGSAQAAVEESEQNFSELIRSIQKCSSEFTQRIRDQEQSALSRADGGLEQMEQEINDLRRRDAELEQLSHTQDHAQFLKTFQALSSPPEAKEVPNIPFTSLFSFDGLRESVRQLRDKLEDSCKEELKTISERVTFTNLVSRTRNDLLQYYRPLTLDLNTVHQCIRLSDSNRMITFINNSFSMYAELPYPDHPERFDNCCQVLCREGVHTRSYWEIEWSGSVCIAVSYKSIRRKGWGNQCEFGFNDQSWNFSNSPSRNFFVHNSVATELPVKPISSRIGVFVDHSAGTLSFYSVSDTMDLIHTVQTIFTYPLYPGFGLDSDSSLKLC